MNLVEGATGGLGNGHCRRLRLVLARRDVGFSLLLLVVRFHRKGYLTLNPNSWWSWVWKVGTVVGSGAGVGVGTGIIVKQYRTLTGKGEMFEIDKTRKHFVPRLYLRGFCLDNRPEQIYAFDKANPQAGVVVRSIENVEVSRDAYSVANDAILKQREDKWAEILRILKGQSVSELNELIYDRERSVALRAWLARFVVDSKQRSRGFREQVSEPANAIRLQLRSKLETVETDLLARFPGLRDELQIILPRFREIAGIDTDRKFEALHLSPFPRGDEGGSWRASFSGLSTSRPTIFAF